MIFAIVGDDDVLILESGEFATTSDRARRVFGSKLLTRDTAEIEFGGVAEDMRDAETPGERMRATVAALQGITLRDDGDA